MSNESEHLMQITRSNSMGTQKGSHDWFTGDVCIDESGNPVTWGRHVTDEEYGTSPTSSD